MGEQLSATARVRQIQDQFIMEWGRMSSSWGINRTMAQIHALLFIAGQPLSVDEIIDRLQISRGNASMNLRDLIDWGIVKRQRRQGDRKDLYASDTDPWMMFARVVRERKRRELDPTQKVIEECLAQFPDGAADEEAQVLHSRLAELKSVFEMVDAVYNEIFRTDETFAQTLKLFGRKDS